LTRPVVHLRDEMTEPLAELEERLEADEFLRGYRRKVHGIADDAVPQKIAERRHRFHADEFLALPRRRGNMGRRDDLRQLLQTVIDGGFLLKHVERRAADLAGFDGVGERRLVD
jgi:hypothetical protein